MATILLVDDRAANREWLVALLRHQGHRLVEAADGSVGLAAAKAEHPDLIITDVLMPVMDGYEFVRQLRLDPATSAIPVIFYTAHYGERDAQALALSSGVATVITKPAEPEEVLTVVANVLAGRTGTAAAGIRPDTPEFDRDHLRLVTDKLSETVDDLRTANARLRALVNIGLELASERDSDQLLRSVCIASQDLFGASYVTLGICDDESRIRYLLTSDSNVAIGLAVGDPISSVFETVVRGRRLMRGAASVGTPANGFFPPGHSAVNAFLIAPIASPAHVYGWMCLVSNDGRTFSEEDEHLAAALAGQVGRIYENGHFYAIAQQRTEELEREMVQGRQQAVALQHERDRAQRYLDTAEVILLTLDMQGRVTQLNRYGCLLLGWTLDELLGQEFIEMCVPARIRDEMRKKLSEVHAGDDTPVENLVVTKSGDERLIEWRTTFLRDDQGNITGTFSSGTDVTARAHAVDALRIAEERMRFALHSANVGVWDMDYRTGTLTWSGTLEAQYGLAPGTFAGTFEAFVERIHPDDRDAVLDMIGKATAAGTDFSTEHRALWPDGTVRWLTGAGRILPDGNGQPLRGVGISLDVTDRRMLEVQYQQAQKMEAIGRLAGGVAHDFNNLLTAILGYCDLLRTTFAPGDPRQSDVLEIHKAGTSAAVLTRQLLAFSRKEIIQPTLLNLNDIVTDMQVMLQRLIGEDIDVFLILRPDVAMVMLDRGQAEQVILNLAVNARDAMPRGGRLTIETKNVDLDEVYQRTHFAVRPGPHVMLAVTDTGTGMTPEVQARLFEPFFTTKDRGRGTGLGLATVHGIVVRSGGVINVYSEEGQGTSMCLYFPQAAGKEVVAATPAPVPLEPQKHTVLVVEDADGLRELARRLLERQGCTVVVAANAAEGVRVFDRHPEIDVLLTDVVMPGPSGPELAKELLTRKPTLKVIYMSGYTEETTVHHGVVNQGILFLHKPFTSESLARKLREAFERG